MSGMCVEIEESLSQVTGVDVGVRRPSDHLYDDVPTLMSISVCLNSGLRICDIICL